MVSPSNGDALEEARALIRRVDEAAAPDLEAIVRRWLPDGRREGREWVSCNPHRDDRRPGSFKVNLCTGRWADFASGDRGGDLVSLAAFLFNLPQTEAARRLARVVGIAR